MEWRRVFISPGLSPSRARFETDGEEDERQACGERPAPSSVPYCRVDSRDLCGAGDAIVGAAAGAAGALEPPRRSCVAFDVGATAASVSSALTLTMLIFGGRSVNLRIAPVLVSAL